MSATRDEISRWFDDGVEAGNTHMIVACDTFDYENYPVYVGTNENVRDVEIYTRGQSMVSVDEVYDLRLDKMTQLAERRAFHY